jgi:hypothetical protein
MSVEMFSHWRRLSDGRIGTVIDTVGNMVVLAGLRDDQLIETPTIVELQALFEPYDDQNRRANLAR